MCVCVFLWERRGGGDTPYARTQGELYRFKFENFDRVRLEPTTSWILVWRSTNWAIRRSDESSLGFLSYTIFLIKFNHFYLGTGGVFLGKGRGGGNARTQGELYRFKFDRWKIIVDSSGMTIAEMSNWC